MNILNQPISPGGHPVFPAAKETGPHAIPVSVRFDGPSTAAAPHGRRWQAQTLRRASSFVGVERDGTSCSRAAPAPACKQLTLDLLRSLLDSAGPPTFTSPPPPQALALRVVVTSAVELDARQTELIARKMRRITGFMNLKVESVVDPFLIAGFVVRYGADDSHVIDLSVKGKLAALKNRVDSIDQTAHAHGNPLH